MQPFHDVTELGEEQTAADDEDIDSHQNLSEGDVPVFVDAGCNDVRTARAAVVEEDDGQSGTGKAAADDQRHEVLSLAEHLHKVPVCIPGHQVLCENQHEIKGEDGIDGLHQELESQDLQSDDQQRYVDDDIGVLDLEACRIVDHSRHTRHSAGHDFVRHKKDGEGCCIEKQAYCQKEIISGFRADELLINSHRSSFVGMGGVSEGAQVCLLSP